MKTLDLVLKHKWYDMIACGEKKEEYRDLTQYWRKRIGCSAGNPSVGVECASCPFGGCYDITHVRFHRGYTSITMTFEIENISIGNGREEWGAESDKEYFVIKLRKQLKETEL